MNPANKGIYFCCYSGTSLLKTQRIDRNISTKLPTNRPKFMESLLIKILKRFLGDLTILLILKITERPLLIR